MMIFFFVNLGYEGNGYECERASSVSHSHQHFEPTMAPCRDCSENGYCSEGK